VRAWEQVFSILQGFGLLGDKRMHAWEQVHTILQGFDRPLDPPKAVPSRNLADNVVVVLSVEEVEVAVANEGGVAGFISSTQGDEGKSNLRRVEDVAEGDDGEVIINRNLDLNRTLANSPKVRLSAAEIGFGSMKVKSVNASMYGDMWQLAPLS
jgi:hypothetical protein